MINRTVVPMPFPTRPDGSAKPKSAPADEKIPVGHTGTGISGSSLVRFLLLVGVVFGLLCVYIWQLSQISAVNLETEALRAKITTLERENVALMLQVAQQNTPEKVEDQATALGMVPFARSVYLTMPAEADPNDPPAVATAESEQPAPWWEQWFTDLAHGQVASQVAQMFSGKIP